MTDDLVKRLRAINRNYELARGVHFDIGKAAAILALLDTPAPAQIIAQAGKGAGDGNA